MVARPAQPGGFAGSVPTAHLGRAAGTVTSFDSERGLGSVRDATGRSLAFHCSAIADGSREIEVGAAVCFEVTAGRLGRWEASEVVLRGRSGSRG